MDKAQKLILRKCGFGQEPVKWKCFSRSQRKSLFKISDRVRLNESGPRGSSPESSSERIMMCDLISSQTTPNSVLPKVVQPVSVKVESEAVASSSSASLQATPPPGPSKRRRERNVSAGGASQEGDQERSSRRA